MSVTLTLTPSYNSIYASLTGLTTSTSARVVQFFLNSASTPSSEELIPANEVITTSTAFATNITGLLRNTSYTIEGRVIDYETETRLDYATGTATCTAQLTLSATSTAINATLTGLASSTSARTIEFYIDSSSTASQTITVAAGSVNAMYSYTFTGLKTNVEHSVTVKVKSGSTVLATFTESAVAGGESTDPSFNLANITTNTVSVELYKGKTTHNYYRLYLYDLTDDETMFADWLSPDSYPKQISGLESGHNYKINVGYGEIYGAGVTWIGRQDFTTVVSFDSGHSDTGKFTMPEGDIDRIIVYNNASSIKKSTFTDTYTRVTITTQESDGSGNIAYSVGNDDGLELELSCPWLASDEAQAIKIATYVLSTINTYQYVPFESNETIVDPAAELGDLISLGSLTSEIVNLDINYENVFNADISAPTSNETEHEFPQGATSKDSTTRYVDGVRAALEVAIDNITAMVENQEGRFQKLQVTLDGVIIQNESGQTIINGANIKTGSIELSTQMYTDGTSTDLMSKIRAMTSATNTAQSTADGATTAAATAQSTAEGAQDTADDALSVANTKQTAEQVSSIIVNDLINTYGISSENAHSVLTSAYIYSPNLVTGTTDQAIMTLNELGILFGTYNSGTGQSSADYARLGYEDALYGSTTVRLPILTLGQGGTSPTSGSGVMKKYYNGVWVGEYFNDSTNCNFSPSRVSVTGLFFNVNNDSLVLSHDLWGDYADRPSSPMDGTIYFATD